MPIMRRCRRLCASCASTSLPKYLQKSVGNAAALASNTPKLRLQRKARCCVRGGGGGAHDGFTTGTAVGLEELDMHKT